MHTPRSTQMHQGITEHWPQSHGLYSRAAHSMQHRHASRHHRPLASEPSCTQHAARRCTRASGADTAYPKGSPIQAVLDAQPHCATHTVLQMALIQQPEDCKDKSFRRISPAQPLLCSQHQDAPAHRNRDPAAHEEASFRRSKARHKHMLARNTEGSLKMSSGAKLALPTCSTDAHRTQAHINMNLDNLEEAFCSTQRDFMTETTGGHIVQLLGACTSAHQSATSA